MNSANTKPIAEVIDTMKSAGLGFERIEHIAGSTYRDSSTVIVIPSRGMIPHQVVARVAGAPAPMNQKRAMLFATGHEVGQAYNAMISNILANPELSKWKYIMTLEDDNIPPADAHIRLLESDRVGQVRRHFRPLLHQGRDTTCPWPTEIPPSMPVGRA